MLNVAHALALKLIKVGVVWAGGGVVWDMIIVQRRMDVVNLCQSRSH